MRVPHYSAANEVAAAEELSAILSGKLLLERTKGIINRNYDATPIKALDDFVMSECFDRAEKYGMNIVIHTGIHAWNNNDVDAVSPKSLCGLIKRYGKNKIVLLHVGYPYIDEAVILARYFPNVYLDMAWVNVLEEKCAEETAVKLLEELPITKVCGFGGDYCQPANIAGNYELTAKHLSAAFAANIEKGIINFNEAVEVIKAWLYDNPKRIYGL